MTLSWRRFARGWLVQSLRRRRRLGRRSRTYSGAAGARYTPLPTERCKCCRSLSGAPTVVGNSVFPNIHSWRAWAAGTNVAPSVSRGQGPAAASPRRNDSHIGDHWQIAGCLSSVDHKTSVCVTVCILSSGVEVGTWTPGVGGENTRWVGVRAHCATRVFPLSGKPSARTLCVAGHMEAGEGELNGPQTALVSSLRGAHPLVLTREWQSPAQRARRTLMSVESWPYSTDGCSNPRSKAKVQKTSPLGRAGWVGKCSES